MTILSVDPGGTIGWVLMSLDGEVLQWGEERDHKAFLDLVWALLNQDPDLDLEVVVERFVITPRARAMTHEPSALYQIGAIRWMCEYTGHVFHMQGPAEAKAFGTKDRLAEYRQVGRGGGGHARMALSHALLYRMARRPS